MRTELEYRDVTGALLGELAVEGTAPVPSNGEMVTLDGLDPPQHANGGASADR